MPTKSPRTRSRPAAGKSARSAPAEQTEERKADGQGTGESATFSLPFVGTELHAPRMPHIDPGEIATVARSFLPPPREVVYYGGLAALAAFEVIEWPVALAIGVGGAILGRRRHEEHEAAGKTSSPTSRRR